MNSLQALPGADPRERLEALTPERLRGMRRGLEKESLRVAAGGALATTPHPAALGSALTHAHITTDFSEAQLELITGVNASADGCIAELERIHRFTYGALGDELMWPSSMPCVLPADDEIPIGQYGTSNVGRAKSVYRAGLGHRYGRRMQTISGIHYNWSLPGVGNAGYFGLIRNFRRQAFLLLVLFGASPAVCSTFVADQPHGLEPFGDGGLHLPHATSLRMGRLGYQSDAQASLAVSYNCLDGYGRSLEDALTRPYPPYEAIGVLDARGEYRQLATTLLQIENEFYGTIRPKRVIFPGERPLHALRERGVEYVEVRLMDLDPFVPAGIRAETLRFLDVFLLHCLLSDSPPDSPQEIAALARNQHRTAARGREPGLMLEKGGREIGLRQWGQQILDGCAPIAAQMDASLGGRQHADAVAAARRALDNPSELPSARVLRAVAEQHQGSFIGFGLAQAHAARDALLAQPLTADEQAHFMALTQRSVAEQREIEAADTLPFEQYRRQYLSPDRLGLPRGLPQAA